MFTPGHHNGCARAEKSGDGILPSPDTPWRVAAATFLFGNRRAWRNALAIHGTVISPTRSSPADFATPAFPNRNGSKTLCRGVRGEGRTPSPRLSLSFQDW